MLTFAAIGLGVVGFVTGIIIGIVGANPCCQRHEKWIY